MQLDRSTILDNRVVLITDLGNILLLVLMHEIVLSVLSNLQCQVRLPLVVLKLIEQRERSLIHGVGHQTGLVFTLHFLLALD